MHHPWDISEVHKGWQLSPEHLEVLTLQKRGTDAYSLAVVDLCKRLERELDRENRPATVAIVKGCLRVLTDAEASLYESKHQTRAIKDIQRRDGKLRQVDVSNLSDEELEHHTHRLMKSTHRVSAIRGARAAIRRVLKARQPKQLGESSDAE